MSGYDWRHNASTGNSAARVSKSVRLVRIGLVPPYLYVAEQWGDYSLAYPKRGPVCKTPGAALRRMPICCPTDAEPIHGAPSRGSYSPERS